MLISSEDWIHYIEETPNQQASQKKKKKKLQKMELS
jgi:hypothetical protein